MITTRPIRENWGPLRSARGGIMLHYDDSGSDVGALYWLTRDPACRVSYNVLVTDNGVAYVIAPLDRRAWHAGECRPSDAAHLIYRDANSAFYGVAIAAAPGDVATTDQVRGVVEVCTILASRHGWDLRVEPWRITGHAAEAWPRGRKIDPTGPDPLRPVLSVAEVRGHFTHHTEV